MRRADTIGQDQHVAVRRGLWWMLPCGQSGCPGARCRLDVGENMTGSAVSATSRWRHPGPVHRRTPAPGSEGWGRSCDVPRRNAMGQGRPVSAAWWSPSQASCKATVLNSNLPWRVLRQTRREAGIAQLHLINDSRRWLGAAQITAGELQGWPGDGEGLRLRHGGSGQGDGRGAGDRPGRADGRAASEAATRRSRQQPLELTGAPAQARFGTVDNERVLSGPGLVTLHALRTAGRADGWHAPRNWWTQQAGDGDALEAGAKRCSGG